ncbi:MAG: glycyl-radical enzyme activating protein [Clostridia bacterium]|nr:glycyl-radical enzyme activating protein [Clostridia bacterium]
MKKPLIFDIKRASLNDGPGVRTVIFFKGCNLNCFWCHNPEGKSPDAQIAFFAEKCMGCGNCAKVCASPAACTVCGACVTGCPTEARRLYGKPYTVEELLTAILADKPYYHATGGGVTFSGGECMLYPDFLANVAERCQKNGVSVAVDTAGNVPYAAFERVLPYTDIFLYDIKALDSALHCRGTGVSNTLILKNLDRLQNSGKKMIIRTPVIPDFNQGEEVERIRAYCAARGLTHELLAYHALGESKREALAAHDVFRECQPLN